MLNRYGTIMNGFEIIASDSSIAIHNFYIDNIINFNTETLNNHIARLYKKLYQNKFNIPTNSKEFPFIENNISPEKISDIYDILDTITNKYMSMCTICSDTINYDGNINCCDKVNCTCSYYELITNNILSSVINTNFATFAFHIHTTELAIKSNKWDKIYGPRLASFDIDVAKKEFSNKSSTSIINRIKSNFLKECKTLSEKDIYNICGMHIYSYVKYGIAVLKDLSIVPEYFEDKILNIDVDIDGKCPIYFKLNTKPNPNKYIYAYHGSPLENWYSILRNGLKICSGTDMQRNGAVYGNGIYLGQDFGTSLSYSTCHNVSNNDSKNDTPSLFAVGVVELNNSEDYKKGTFCYVATNENDVVLKYIVIINNSTNTNANKIQNRVVGLNQIKKQGDHFTKIYNTALLNNAIAQNIILEKRFANEIKKVKELNFKDITIDDYNVLINVNDNDFINIDMSNDYPHKCPKLTYMKGNNTNITRIMTVDNHIKIMGMDEAWTIKMNIANIMKIIMNILNDCSV